MTSQEAECFPSSEPSLNRLVQGITLPHVWNRADQRCRDTGVPVGDAETPDRGGTGGAGGLSGHNPAVGELVPGTGGVRKLRWGLEGRGKRGGARVIYFYHSADIPLFALTAYAKNERADLSQKDRNDFRQLTKLLAEIYGRTKR
jgi:hypothetical protein